MYEPVGHWLAGRAIIRVRDRNHRTAVRSPMLFGRRVPPLYRLGPEAAHLLPFASGQRVLPPTGALEPGQVVIGTPAIPDGAALAALISGVVLSGS